LWKILWSGKWRITVIAGVFLIAALAYAVFADQWYRAEALLAPAEEQSQPGLAAQFGGIASLAGINLDAGDSVEPVAVLQSRAFARAFISDFKLIPVFFSGEWDSAKNRWRDDDAGGAPDIRDAVEFFHEKVLKVSKDRATGLVTLAIEWTDPGLAARWANSLVERLNASLRERALREAEHNVAFLETEMAQTNVITLQQSIGRLLENELQKLMMARGNDEFAFRVIDVATTPKDPVWPNALLFGIAGLMVGAILGMFVVLIGHVACTSQTE
jgi:uncharacterized protein involved in exopolysaccharide biosynthesis